MRRSREPTTDDMAIRCLSNERSMHQDYGFYKKRDGDDPTKVLF